MEGERGREKVACDSKNVVFKRVKSNELLQRPYYETLLAVK